MVELLVVEETRVGLEVVDVIELVDVVEDVVDGGATELDDSVVVVVDDGTEPFVAILEKSTKRI